MRMSPSDEDQIIQFAGTLKTQVTISLLLAKDRGSLDLSEFAERLSQLVPRVSVKRENDPAPDPAAILIGQNLRCHFLPQGSELTAFLHALAYLQLLPPAMPAQVSRLADAIQLPADFQLYVSHQCPFCPSMLNRLIPLAFASPLVRLSIIDPAFCPELAEANGVRSVPTLILDNRLRWSGAVDLEELTRVIADRDPSALSGASLDMLLKDGQAGRLAKMMADSKRLYSGFWDLLFHTSWPTRLGAMVVVEQLIEIDPDLAGRLPQRIWERFAQLPATVQGDMLYLIGELRCPAQIGEIQAVLDGSHNEDVKEAAREAMAKLRTI
jgi:alkyl hydroperoxide reductase subunit AhpF